MPSRILAVFRYAPGRLSSAKVRPKTAKSPATIVYSFQEFTTPLTKIFLCGCLVGAAVAVACTPDHCDGAAEISAVGSGKVAVGTTVGMKVGVGDGRGVLVGTGLAQNMMGRLFSTSSVIESSAVLPALSVTNNWIVCRPFMLYPVAQRWSQEISVK